MGSCRGVHHWGDKVTAKEHLPHPARAPRVQAVPQGEQLCYKQAPAGTFLSPCVTIASPPSPRCPHSPEGCSGGPGAPARRNANVGPDITLLAPGQQWGHGAGRVPTAPTTALRTWLHPGDNTELGSNPIAPQLWGAGKVTVGQHRAVGPGETPESRDPQDEVLWTPTPPRRSPTAGGGDVSCTVE